MIKSEEQIVDVNHFDNHIVVKFEDGTVALLDGAKVRRYVDARGGEFADRVIEPGDPEGYATITAMIESGHE